MSLFESDSALFTQTNYSCLHTAPANFGKRSVHKIATKTLDFLRRNVAFVPRSTKEAAYKALVCPKLEYVAPIWSPFCKPQIQQVEKVHMTIAHRPAGDGATLVV